MARIAGMMMAAAGLVLAGMAKASARQEGGAVVLTLKGPAVSGWWQEAQEGAQAPEVAPLDFVPAWEPSPAADPYLAAVYAAEDRHGLPRNLLARVIEQESAWQPDAESPAGAQGIAQIIPRWHPGVDTWDAFDSINYAALYLRENFDRFGSWSLALAAYNWGPTVLQREGIEQAPAETRNYLARILGDLPGVV